PDSTRRRITTVFARLALAATLAAGNAQAQQLIDLAQSPFDSRVGVPPLLMLAFEVGPAALSSAWPGTYVASRAHEGYFDHRKCYRHDARDGLFVIDADADSEHSCSRTRALYSGNFLNWASMTMVD